MKRLDEDRRKRALAWLERGFAPSVIARELGCSTRTVQRIARGLDERDDTDGRNVEAETGHEGIPAEEIRWCWVNVAAICGFGALLLASVVYAIGKPSSH